VRIVWSQEAAADFEEIVLFIAQKSPEAAHRVAKEIYDTINQLIATPLRGRKRVEDDGLEIIFDPWPYLAVYEVIDQQLYIKAIRHTSRNWVH
jgi:plasmid stabilization system protein ParE